MQLSYTHQFIFFHVAKTGGISIREALQSYTQEPEEFKIKRPPRIRNGKPNPLYEMWEAFLLHAKASDAQKALPAEVYNTFYKFAFVRNPWDWQVSMYHFILRETTHVRHDIVKSMSSFEQYLEWVIATQKPYPKGATKLQKDVLTDQDGRLIVDFVGRFENLSEDFAHICQVLNIDACLPHRNKTSHRDYRTYYNESSKRLVEEHFQEDIALFGYTFDGFE